MKKKFILFSTLALAMFNLCLADCSCESCPCDPCTCDPCTCESGEYTTAMEVVYE